MLAYIEAVARHKARAAAFSFSGLILLFIGIGFLVAALWITLAEMRDPLFAALVLGIGLVGIAIILFGISSLIGRRPPRMPRSSTSSSPAIQLIEGFLVGMDVGRRSGRRRR